MKHRKADFNSSHFYRSVKNFRFSQFRKFSSIFISCYKFLSGFSRLFIYYFSS